MLSKIDTCQHFPPRFSLVPSLSLFRTNIIDLEKLRFCSSGKLVQYLTLNCTMARKVVMAVASKKTAKQVEPLFIPFDQ